MSFSSMVACRPGYDWRIEPLVAAGSCQSEGCIGAPMRKFSKREMLIFVVCILLGTALIGLGMAYVIQLKQRILPSGQPAKQSGIRPVLCDSHLCQFNSGIVGESQLARKMKITRTAAASRENPADVGSACPSEKQRRET
jgi:hypothetical protein